MTSYRKEVTTPTTALSQRAGSLKMAEEEFTILEQVPNVVQINVGGTLFLTSRETLYKVRQSHGLSSQFIIPCTMPKLQYAGISL